MVFAATSACSTGRSSTGALHAPAGTSRTSTGATMMHGRRARTGRRAVTLAPHRQGDGEGGQEQPAGGTAFEGAHDRRK